MKQYLQHPMEASALHSLASNKNVVKVLHAFEDAYGRLTDLATLPLYNYPLTRDTAPRVYKLYRRALRQLGIETEYPLYGVMEYALTAKTIGTEHDCAILINSACIDRMTDDQLTALLGQQLGHILFGHVKYMSAFQALDSIVAGLPKFVSVAVDAVKFLFQDWMQYANFTADRTAAVACGTVEPVIGNLIQGMGGRPDSQIVSYSPDMFTDVNLPAASELNTVGKLVFQSMMNQVAFPLGLLRIQELQKWASSEQCRQEEPHICYDYHAMALNAARRDGRTPSLTLPEFQKGMVTLHAAARNGDTTAMGKLGKRYLYGNGELTANRGYGMQMLRQAASLGDGDAQLQLSRMLIEGTQVKRDKNAARMLLDMAAAQGLTQARQLIQDNYEVLAVIPPADLREASRKYTALAGGNSYRETVDQETQRQLMQKLWIPTGEQIIVWDGFMEDTCLVALTMSGFYLCQETGLPQKVSWESLRRGEKRLDWQGKDNTVMITLDGKVFRAINKSQFRGSVFGLISYLRSAMK